MTTDPLRHILALSNNIRVEKSKVQDMTKLWPGGEPMLLWYLASEVSDTLSDIIGTHPLTSVSPPGKPQDTMDRKQRQESPTDGGDEGSGNDRSNDSKGENDGRGMGELSSSSVGGKGLTEDHPEATEKLINAALNRELVLLYLQYFIYDSPVPASFVRSLPLTLPMSSSPFYPPDRMYEPHACMTIVATSERLCWYSPPWHPGTR